MKKYRIIYAMAALLVCPTSAMAEKNGITHSAPGAGKDDSPAVIGENGHDTRDDSSWKAAAPDTAWRDVPMGFDRYPKRPYTFLFNNVLGNTLATQSKKTFGAIVPVPLGTIPALKTFESGYSMLERLSNYPVNLLYDKIGVGWTGLIVLIKAALLDFPFAYTMKVVNHEFSGHTVRICESAQYIEKIDVGVPLPWGKGGGVTYGYMTKSIDRMLLVSVAGSEANTALAHEMSLGFVFNRVIYPFDILLYLETRFDELLYISNATDRPSGLRFDVNGDYQHYLVMINNKYGRIFPHTYRLMLDDLKRWSYVALADPFLYMAAGAFFYNLVTGTRYMKTWMIPLGNAGGMMPSARVAYTPNGPECFGDLFLNLPAHAVLLVYARGGSTALRQTWGFGARLYTIDLGRFVELGGGLDLFSQPRTLNYTSTYYLENVFWNRFYQINPLEQYGALAAMDLLYGYRARGVRRVFGGAGYVDLAIKGGDVFRAYVRMGYKSRGYVFGLKLNKGFFWHTGIGFNF